MKRGLWRSGNDDETWAYSQDQAGEIQAALGADFRTQAEAMKKILKASRLFRKFSGSQEAESKSAEISKQLKALQDLSQALLEELDSVHMDTYVTLLKRAPESEDRLTEVKREVDWLRSITAQAFDDRQGKTVAPPQAALELYICDLMRVFKEYASREAGCSRPGGLCDGLEIGPGDLRPPDDRLAVFVRACTAGLVQWGGPRGAQNALSARLKDQGGS